VKAGYERGEREEVEEQLRRKESEGQLSFRTAPAEERATHVDEHVDELKLKTDLPASVQEQRNPRSGYSSRRFERATRLNIWARRGDTDLKNP